MRVKHLVLIVVSIFALSCTTNTTSSNPKNKSQTAMLIEDKKAAELASKMMKAMGGMEKWEELKYVSWTFFGARHLVWDKVNNRVRIESPRDSSVYLVNLDEATGRYAYNGTELLEPKELSEKMNRGKSIWINDMYWLFMPFKVYDEGVTVKHLRIDTTLKGVLSEVLELRFTEVGDTPENKYEIFLDQTDHLVKQWNYFDKADQDKPSKIWPWDNYSAHNGLLLSSDRSDKSGPSNVKVYSQLDDKVFTSFEAFSFY